MHVSQHRGLTSAFQCLAVSVISKRWTVCVLVLLGAMSCEKAPSNSSLATSDGSISVSVARLETPTLSDERLIESEENSTAAANPRISSSFDIKRRVDGFRNVFGANMKAFSGGTLSTAELMNVTSGTLKNLQCQCLRLLVDQENRLDAETICKEVLKIPKMKETTRSRFRLFLAMALIDQQKYAEVEPILAKMIEGETSATLPRDIRDDDILFAADAFAEIRRKQERYEEAIAYKRLGYETAVAEDTGLNRNIAESAVLDYVLFLMRLGRNDEALDVLDTSSFRLQSKQRRAQAFRRRIISSSGKSEKNTPGEN